MPDLPTTKDALMARIRDRWDALQGVVAPLTPEQLERPLGDGWSTKVHLAHMATWERSLLGLLRKQHRGDAMNVPRDLWDGHDTDAINAQVAVAAAGRPLGDVLAESAAVHAEVIAQLESMSQDDLGRPYSDYQPGDAAHNPNPVAGWVHGNTWDHYNEHIEWIASGLRG